MDVGVTFAILESQLSLIQVKLLTVYDNRTVISLRMNMGLLTDEKL